MTFTQPPLLTGRKGESHLFQPPRADWMADKAGGSLASCCKSLLMGNGKVMSKLVSHCRPLPSTLFTPFTLKPLSFAVARLKRSPAAPGDRPRRFAVLMVGKGAPWMPTPTIPNLSEGGGPSSGRGRPRGLLQS